MSYNKTKTDPELGRRIHEHLVKCGVETPVKETTYLIDRKAKIDVIEHLFTQIMQALNLDLTDDSLTETPKRVAKMYVNEIFWGLDWEAFPKCTTVDNKMKYDEMVIERNVNVQSNCEHVLQSKPLFSKFVFAQKGYVLFTSWISIFVVQHSLSMLAMCVEPPGKVHCVYMCVPTRTLCCQK